MVRFLLCVFFFVCVCVCVKLVVSGGHGWLSPVAQDPSTVAASDLGQSLYLFLRQFIPF